MEAPLLTWRFESGLLEEAAVFQVLLDDDVGDGIEHKLDVLCVCCTGHVRVDFFDIFTQVEIQKLHFDVETGVFVRVGTLMRNVEKTKGSRMCYRPFFQLERLYGVSVMCACHELTIIFREAHVQVSFLDLLNEDIFLVEEENE